MSKKDEALKLAEDALKRVRTQDMELVQLSMIALAAIREALAEQPAPPPECQTEAEKTAFAFGWFKALETVREQPPQQEPVAWICEGSSSDEKHAIDYWPGNVDDLPIGTQLYTSPPAQHTRVGLTRDEVLDIKETTKHPLEFYRAIEVKLREKNQ